MFLLIPFLKNIKKLFLSSCIVASLMSSVHAKGMPKEYYQIKDTKKAKKYFFKYMYKLAKKENIKILNERELVVKILHSNILELDLNSKDFKKLIKIKNKYKIKKLFTITDYLKKIDVVPPSMALAQAAVESGWGKSRFIKKANNIFGQWTYTKSKGLIPKDRESGKKHYIRIYSSLEASIGAYMLNLNSNFAYPSFRNLRYKERLKGRNPNGLALSQTMLRYSGIGKEYLKMLKNMILKNDLRKYDKMFYKSIKPNFNHNAVLKSI